MWLTVASACLLGSLLFNPAGPLATGVLSLVWLALALRREPSVDRAASTGSPSPWAPAVIVLLVVVVAASVRWPIASHDVEHYTGPDEGEVVENVLEMIRRSDFDHRHPGYPGLHFYLQQIPARVRLAATGRSIPELPRADFYRNARQLSLVLGVLAAAFVFLAGRQLVSSGSAALAAALVAASPLAFRESAVVNPDLVLSFFVSASIWLSLRAMARPSWLTFALAGVSVGLATATKYTGLFALGPYCAAWLLSESPRRDVTKWLCGGALAVVAFGFVSPYTLLNVPAFVRGLTHHVGYYQAASLNASFELTRQVASRGVGVVAALAALGAALRALAVVDRRVLVVMAYPVGYWFVFAFFDRAFPRHALVLIPVTALLAADALERIGMRWARPAAALAAIAFVAPPGWDSLDLARRARRSTPADAAATWVSEVLPAGSRILQDQYTPALDPSRFDVVRLRVDDEKFVGNYGWVLHSGYPPGLSTDGLREVRRFENDEALGDRIVLYQVPERASLMPTSFRDGDTRVAMRAGELPYFGDGWSAPEAGAHETSRLSDGPRSEIFFVLPPELSGPLTARLFVSAVERDCSVTITLNDRELGGLVAGRELEAHPIALPDGALRPGLNRIVLSYGETHRLDRRHRATALRFYRMVMER